MKLLKTFIKKYLSLSLGTLVALVLMTSVTACRGCNKKLDETTGKLEIIPSRIFLQGDHNRKVELIFKLAADQTNSAKLDNLDLVIEVASTGTGKVTYEVDGTTEEVKVAEKSKVKLDRLLGVSEIGENDDRKAIFKFEPDVTTQDIDIKVYAVDAEGNEMAKDVTVNWKQTPVNSFELQQIEGLEAGNHIKATNKFTVKVKKQGGQVVTGDESNLVVEVISIPNDHTAATINSFGNQITFVNTDIKNDVFEKELEVTSGSAETTFTFQLKVYGNKVPSTQTAICKAAAAPYALTFDQENNNILEVVDGSTQIKATVTKGGEELDAKALRNLKLNITGGEGAKAKLANIEKGSLTFRNAHVLTLAGNKKSASIDLTITPGTDKKAKFEVELLDDQGKAIPNTKKTIEWSNGANLGMSATYDANRKEVTVVINNMGKLKLEANQAKLTWDSGNDKITIKGNRTGNQNLPEVLVGKDTQIELDNVSFIDTKITSTLQLKLTWDKLEKAIVKDDVMLAADANIVKALQGQKEAEEAQATIATDLGSRKAIQNFAAALVKVKKAEEGLKKAQEAQEALGDDRVDAQVTAAEKAYKDTKKLYDEAVKVHVDAAEVGKTQAEGASAKIGNDLGKQTAQGFAAARGKLKDAKDGWEKAQKAQKKLGDNRVDAQVTAAEKAYNATKQLYDEAVKAHVDAANKGRTEAKDAKTKIGNDLGKQTAQGFADAKDEVTKAKAGWDQALAAKSKLGDSVNAQVDEAKAAYKDTKKLYDEALKGQVKAADEGKKTARGAQAKIGTDLSRNTPEGFAAAKGKVEEAEGGLKKALAAKAALGDNSVDAQVTAAEKAYKDTKQLYDEAVKGQVKAANKGKPEAEGAKKDIGTDNTPKGFRDALVKVTKTKDRWDEALAAKAKLGDNSVDAQVTAAEKAYKDTKKSYDDAVKVYVEAANEGKIAAEDAKKDIDTDLGPNTPEGFTAALGKVNKAKSGRDQAKEAKAKLGDNRVDAEVIAAEKAYKDTKKSYDEAVKVHVEAANKGKRDAKKAQDKIGTDLSKNTPAGFRNALDKVNEAKAGWDQALAAKAALGDRVNAQVDKAEQAYHATKKSYDEAIAAKEEEVKDAKGVTQAKAEEVHHHLKDGHMVKAMWAAKAARKAAWKALEAADALPEDWASRTENVKIAKDAVEISNKAVQEYNATLKDKKDPGKDIYTIKTT